MSPPDSPVEAVVRHYERALARHGATAEGMDWRDEASQRLRFEILCEVMDLDGLAVHEVGAGAGHLADYLASQGVRAEYSGSDLSAAMIEAARERRPDLSFERRDWLRAGPERAYDVILGSGLFHVKLDAEPDAWWRHVRAMLGAMYRGCREAIAFNLMSDLVDFRSDRLFYANPGVVLDFCRRELSPRVVIRHDYPLFEFTVYVRRPEHD